MHAVMRTYTYESAYDDSGAAAYDARAEAAFATGDTAYGDYINADGTVVILDAATIANLLAPNLSPAQDPPPPAPDPPPSAPFPSPDSLSDPLDPSNGSDDNDGWDTDMHF